MVRIVIVTKVVASSNLEEYFFFYLLRLQTYEWNPPKHGVRPTRLCLAPPWVGSKFKCTHPFLILVEFKSKLGPLISNLDQLWVQVKPISVSSQIYWLSMFVQNSHDAKNTNLWKNKFCLIFIIKSWDEKFMMWSLKLDLNLLD